MASDQQIRVELDAGQAVETIKAIHRSKQPFYLSAGWLAFVLTVGTMIVALAMGAPEGVTEKLADAIWFGLPLLIAGGKLVDHARVKAIGGAVGAATPEVKA